MFGVRVFGVSVWCKSVWFECLVWVFGLSVWLRKKCSWNSLEFLL
jgi:hypothetical protein